MQHRPRKCFGQNFLQSPTVIQAIVDAIHPQKTDNMVEIGPGLGALTLPLLNALSQLTVIEIDRDLQQHLKQHLAPHHQLSVVNADVLTVDFSQFGAHTRVVGNLPYNISTPLLFHLLKQKSMIEDMHFMLQKEVVERIVALPGSKTYGRLSIMIQLQCEVECLFFVPATAFHPAPKVESAVIRIRPHRVSPYPDVCLATLQQVVTTAFSMRRKTLSNALKSLINATALSTLNIDPSKRPEQLSILEYIHISKYIQNAASSGE